MREKATTNALDWDSCPVCGSSWDGGSILETFVKKREAGDPYYRDQSDQDLIKMVRDFYGDASRRWRRCTGIEIMGGYDGISYVQCPDCKATFDRFTGEKADALFDSGGRFREDLPS